MTDQQHPITPPPELIQQWIGEFFGCVVSGELSDSEKFLAAQAARWGADMELEACCEWLEYEDEKEKLRAARRPKPKSLAEKGYDALDTYIYGNPDPRDKERTYNTLRRALERLQELEGQGDG